MVTIEERARKAYPENHPCDYECRDGFRKACEEYESLPKIRGWVARDEDGEVAFFYGDNNKPIRNEFGVWRNAADEYIHLDSWSFPEIERTHNEPVEVELLIRKV